MMRWPWMTTSPAVVGISPATSMSSVLFPQPEGPDRHELAHAEIERDRVERLEGAAARAIGLLDPGDPDERRSRGFDRRARRAEFRRHPRRGAPGLLSSRASVARATSWPSLRTCRRGGWVRSASWTEGASITTRSARPPRAIP